MSSTPGTAARAGTRICPRCGAPAPPSCSFCQQCGAALGASPSASEPAPSAPDAFLGTTIAQKYRIDSKVGAGGMATVYRATRLMIGDTVAVKILHRAQLDDPRISERFRREAQAAARLKHPNAVTIYDFGVSDEGTLYLVMELVEGQSLRTILKQQGPFTPTSAAEIMTQVCAALDEAHRQNIVHRDIKPDNVMVGIRSDSIRVKVLDFGIARMRDVAAMNLTQTGTVMGTPHYMSPEQCLGEELDSRSDIYSLGVVLYEMLAGVVPFNSPTSTAVIVQHVNQGPPPLRVLNVSISPAVESVVLHALGKRREDRPQSARQLADELNAAVYGGTAPFQSAGLATAVQTPTLATTVQLQTSSWGTAHSSAGVGLAPAAVAPTVLMQTPQPGSLATTSRAHATVPAKAGLHWPVLASAAVVVVAAAVGVTWKLAKKGSEQNTQTAAAVTTSSQSGTAQSQPTNTPVVTSPVKTENNPPVTAGTEAPVATPSIASGQPPAALISKLVVKSIPGGARVLIDNSSAGVTNADGVLNLKQQIGRHFITVQKDGYQPWQSTITVVPKSSTLEAALTAIPAKLSITPVPADARIEIAGVGSYSSPISAMPLPPGHYQLVVTHSGYKRFETSVDLNPGGVSAIPVTLAPLSTEDMMRELQTAFAAQNYDRVIAGAPDMLSRDSSNGGLNRMLGLSYFQRHQYSQSQGFLLKALDSGESFDLPIKHHRRDPRGFGLSGDQFCDGTLTFKKGFVAFHSNCENEDFEVPGSKIYELKYEPQKAGRVSVRVAAANRKTYNFHCPTAGLRPANSSQPDGIQNAYCSACESMTQLYYQLFVKIKQ